MSIAGASAMATGSVIASQNIFIGLSKRRYATTSLEAITVISVPLASTETAENETNKFFSLDGVKRWKS